MHPRSPNNLLLITYRRSEDQATYRNFAEINYEREYKNGLPDGMGEKGKDDAAR